MRRGVLPHASETIWRWKRKCRVLASVLALLPIRKAAHRFSSCWMRRTGNCTRRRCCSKARKNCGNCRWVYSVFLKQQNAGAPVVAPARKRNELELLTSAFNPAVRSVPIPSEVLPSIMMGDDPASADVGRPGPIACMPDIVPVHRAPKSVDPYVSWSWGDRPYPDHTRRRWCADCDSHGHLRGGRRADAQ